MSKVNNLYRTNECERVLLTTHRTVQSKQRREREKGRDNGCWDTARMSCDLMCCIRRVECANAAQRSVCMYYKLSNRSVNNTMVRIYFHLVVSVVVVIVVFIVVAAAFFPIRCDRTPSLYILFISLCAYCMLDYLVQLGLVWFGKSFYFALLFSFTVCAAPATNFSILAPPIFTLNWKSNAIHVGVQCMLLYSPSISARLKTGAHITNAHRYTRTIFPFSVSIRTYKTNGSPCPHTHARTQPEQERKTAMSSGTRALWKFKYVHVLYALIKCCTHAERLSS